MLFLTTTRLTSLFTARRQAAEPQALHPGPGCCGAACGQVVYTGFFREGRRGGAAAGREQAANAHSGTFHDPAAASGKYQPLQLPAFQNHLCSNRLNVVFGITFLKTGAALSISETRPSPPRCQQHSSAPPAPGGGREPQSRSLRAARQRLSCQPRPAGPPAAPRTKVTPGRWRRQKRTEESCSGTAVIPLV